MLSCCPSKGRPINASGVGGCRLRNEKEREGGKSPTSVWDGCGGFRTHVRKGDRERGDSSERRIEKNSIKNA